jgi:DHA1 family tetracycline resistance protein-like MFS transporter
MQASRSNHLLEGGARKRALGLIFFIMLMDIIGLSIIFPVAPFVVGRYSHEAIAITLLTVIYAAAQFVSAPILGRISDRLGRRPVLLASVIGSAIGYFIFGIGGALWVLFLARLIDGVTAGNLSTAAAYIADVSEPEERARSFALIGMAYGFGFILGPALGGILSQIGLDAPAFVAGILMSISAGLIFFILPESLPEARRETTPMRAADLNPFASIGQMARKPMLGMLLLVYCLFNFAFDGINSITGVFVTQKFEAQAWQLGLFLVLAGVATAVVQAALVGRVMPRMGEKRMATVSLLSQAIGGLLIFLAPALWMLYPIGFVASALTGFIFPAMATLTTTRVSASEQGILAGVNAALAGLMGAVGPLVAGLLYDLIAPGAPFALSATVLFAAAMLMAGMRVPRLQPAEGSRGARLGHASGAHGPTTQEYTAEVG